MVPRLVWLSLLLPLGCFSEGDVGGSTGGETTSPGSESSATTVSTSPPTSSSESGTVTETTTSDVESATSVTTTDPDTGEQCGGGFIEIPELPIGWDGVFALSPGGMVAPECPPTLVDLGPIVEDPMVRPCACTCDPACWVWTSPNADCGEPTSVLEAAYDEACDAPIDVENAPFHVEVIAELAEVDGCDAPESAPVVDGMRRRACEHTDGTPCVPAPPDFLAPCVRHDGDVPCPNGPFSRKVLTVESLEVACGACDPCVEAAIDACVNATASLFSEPECMGDEVQASTSMCSPEAGASVRFDFELACPGAEPIVEGAEGERTYCCVP